MNGYFSAVDALWLQANKKRGTACVVLTQAYFGSSGSAG